MTDLSKFKPIIGYSDYLINENGQVYSKKRNKLLSPGKNGNGYMYVTLCKHGKPKTLKVHRLVAMTFLDNPNNLPQINHIDVDKLNNHISNLEFCTVAYNQQHAWKLGLKENTRAAARKTGKITGKIYGKLNAKHLDENLKELFDDIFINKLKTKDIVKKYNFSCRYIGMIKSKRFLKTAISEYFGDKDNVISVNINECHGNVRHLDDNLQNLFDDIFKNQLKTKDIANKYNLSQPYVSQIKSKKLLKVAISEYFGVTHEQQ